jgi:predicted ATPase/DNA-binding CsgD family transcriptional regulator
MRAIGGGHQHNGWMGGHDRLTDREAEVLQFVAERLGNQAIAERLHVSKRTVESHIAALRRKLGVTGRAELADVGMDLRRAEGASTSAMTTPLTRLIGRDRETADLAALIETHRLVTLTGPAGVGKTRLAVHLAANVEGARLADLAPVDHELVGDTLARALGVVSPPGVAVRDVLREAAGGVQGLLLVDNCEHVIGEAAELIDELLAAGGRLRVLATSREPLGVPGEVSYPVPTLPVPIGLVPDAATAGAFDAVKLFVDLAAAASPGFTLTDDVAAAVAALCRRLDGLPLAIELAASRVRSFGPAELVAHLDQRFDLLSRGSRTAPPRHRTLRNAIDWSYQLLDKDERALFDRLGVFPAEFDYPAVVSVAGDHDAVIAVLPRLVDKSLVSATGHGRHRYRLLETIRVYAGEQLTSSGHRAAVKARHAAHYLTLAERAAEHLRGPDQRAWVHRLTVEQPNLRAAFAYCVVTGDIDAAWRWITALERFWDTAGHRREAYDWIQRARAIGLPPATTAAATGLAAAAMLLRPADTRTGFELARRAEDLAVGLDDLTRARAARAVGMSSIWVRPELVQPSLVESLTLFGPDQPWERAVTLLGMITTCGDADDVLRWGQESHALLRQTGDRSSAANLLFVMAQRYLYAGIIDDAVERWLTESAALADEAGSDDDQAHAIVGFAQLAWLRGDHERAAELMGECLPTLIRLGDERCTGRALHILGARARERGRLAEAEELLRGSIKAIARAGQTRVLVDALDVLVDVVAASGRPRPAAILSGAAHHARENAAPHVRPNRPPDHGLRQRLREALGAAAFDEAFREGERLTPTQAIDER